MTPLSSCKSTTRRTVSIRPRIRVLMKLSRHGTQVSPLRCKNLPKLSRHSGKRRRTLYRRILNTSQREMPWISSPTMAGEPTTCVTVSVEIISRPRRTDTKQHVVWSNFEIADMDFWRSEAYSKFFEHLDATGGFYYEVSFPISRR